MVLCCQCMIKMAMIQKCPQNNFSVRSKKEKCTCCWAKTINRNSTTKYTDLLIYSRWATYLQCYFWQFLVSVINSFYKLIISIFFCKLQSHSILFLILIQFFFFNFLFFNFLFFYFEHFSAHSLLIVAFIMGIKS